MDFEHRPNIFPDFDFAALEDPEFKEDSVREELIAPLLKALGYASTGNFKIVRSRPLAHPFLSIGSRRKPVKLIPDYLLEVDGKPTWVLDAKAPSESISESEHIEQAYSYAIHPEVRVQYFALCNGRQFALFDIYKREPILQIDLVAIAMYWGDLGRLLLPKNVRMPDLSLKKDLGLHLRRLGFQTFESIIFQRVPLSMIARLDENLYTTGVTVELDDSYVASFDFDKDCLENFRGRIPNDALDILSQPFDGVITNLKFVDAVYYVAIDCSIVENLQENEREIFEPLRINRLID
jgi:hypothetical protein